MNSVKLITILTGYLLTANTLFAFDRQDTLRGSNGRGRDWWDVKLYSLAIRFDTASRSVSGSNTIVFQATSTGRDSMQIDLQEPMMLDSVLLNDKVPVRFSREGNVYWLVSDQLRQPLNSVNNIRLFYHGRPREAVKPPWDGGFIWIRDSLDNPWVAVACQGLGASSWWPCKDYQGDEPDIGSLGDICLKTEFRGIPASVEVISNGRGYTADPENGGYDLSDGGELSERTAQFFVENQVNTYDVTFYMGDYTRWSDTFQGRKGVLDLYFCPLRYHESQAREQFKQVKQMLQAFEYWFGPYPFYEDGYKIVEAPFLGMEHQSAIAYGNLYRQGYQGKDRSGTGVGLLFDFIIVHESGHEWFGNSVTAADIADNWIHEGFTTYSETLFTEYWYGREKAFEYCRGEWKNIRNDKPVIGTYGVHDGGSGDKYDKGSALVHTIRLLMNDDERFRSMLHAICDTFRHRQISSAQMEDFIIRYSGLQLQPVFEQYLRTTDIPELEYTISKKKLKYRFNHIVPGFSLPVTTMINGAAQRLQPIADWQELELNTRIDSISVPPAFLIKTTGLVPAKK